MKLKIQFELKWKLQQEVNEIKNQRTFRMNVMKLRADGDLENETLNQIKQLINEH